MLSRAIDDEVFEPYVAAGIADGSIDIAPEFLDLVPNGEATPVDYGDVCVNYDIGWFAERELAAPTSFDDLTDPAYAGQLVVQNPATSSPGLAFLLATIHEYGLEGWQDYWSRLRRERHRGRRQLDAGLLRALHVGGGADRRRWWSATDRAHRPR